MGFLLVVRGGGGKACIRKFLLFHVLRGGKGLESENEEMYALDGFGYK